MSEYPNFEVWGGCCDDLSFWNGGQERHLEDCFSLEEARFAAREWQKNHYAAWVQNKDNGDILPCQT
jgi:hypothetical protein